MLEAVLQKNDAICNHTVQESFAMGESQTAYIEGNENHVDLVTKSLCNGKRRYLVHNILHEVYKGGFKPHMQ